MRAPPADHACGEVGEIGVVPECFSRKYIGQVHLDKSNADGGKCVPHRNACMGIGCGVDDDEIDLLAAGTLYALDQFGFGIALEQGEHGTGSVGLIP